VFGIIIGTYKVFSLNLNIMKSSVLSFFAIILLIFSSNSYAQTDSLVNRPNLLIPRFTKSVVKLKSGDIKTAWLNYNKVDQEMVFMQKDLFLVLTDPQLIDSVFMANRTFVPMEKGFYEVIYKAPVTLFIQHKSYVEHEGYPTLYGAKSQTTAPSYVRQIYGANGAIDLKIPQEYKVVDDSQYWVRYNNQMRPFETKRAFLKIFPEKEKELNQYISKYDIDFKNVEKVKNLIQYCNSLME
jgi:hypothetical protein